MYVAAFICLAALILGGGIGYYLGRYQAQLIDTIEHMRHANDKPLPEAPTVTLGDYTPPRPMSTTPDDRRVGLVESKTPERLDFETTIAIEKEVLGR